MSHSPGCPRASSPFARCICEAPTPTASSPWSDEADDRLLADRARGHSFTQCAVLLTAAFPGRKFTRNSVKGRLERLASWDERRVDAEKLREMERE